MNAPVTTAAVKTAAARALVTHLFEEMERTRLAFVRLTEAKQRELDAIRLAPFPNLLAEHLAKISRITAELATAQTRYTLLGELCNVHYRAMEAAVTGEAP